MRKKIYMFYSNYNIHECLNILNKMKKMSSYLSGDYYVDFDVRFKGNKFLITKRNKIWNNKFLLNHPFKKVFYGNLLEQNDKTVIKGVFSIFKSVYIFFTLLALIPICYILYFWIKTGNYSFFSTIIVILLIILFLPIIFIPYIINIITKELDTNDKIIEAICKNLSAKMK